MDCEPDEDEDGTTSGPTKKEPKNEYVSDDVKSPRQVLDDYGRVTDSEVIIDEEPDRVSIVRQHFVAHRANPPDQMNRTASLFSSSQSFSKVYHK